MAESPNLGILHLNEAQAQKHTTVNAGFDRIDNSLHETHTQAADADGNTDIGTTAEFQDHGRFDITGALTATENINLPTTVARWFMIRNSTTGGEVVNVQVTGGGGAGVAIDAGVWYILHSDGTDVELINKSSANQIAYSGYADGSAPPQFGSAQTVLRIPIAFDVTFPANFAGSPAAQLATATTASTTFDVRKAASGGGGEVSIGSIIFAASANTSTFATSGGTTQQFLKGTILIIRAPGTQDLTADEIGYSLIADKDI